MNSEMVSEWSPAKSGGRPMARVTPVAGVGQTGATHIDEGGNGW